MFILADKYNMPDLEKAVTKGANNLLSDCWASERVLDIIDHVFTMIPTSDIAAYAAARLSERVTSFKDSSRYRVSRLTGCEMCLGKVLDT